MLAGVLLAASVEGGSPARAESGPAESELAARRERYQHARGAAAVVPLLGIGELDDQLLDGGAGLVDFLRGVVARAAGDPLVIAQARMQLASLLDRRGLRAEATRVRAPLGLASRDVLLVGPFANDAGAELGAATPLAPEPILLGKSIAMDATWPSGSGEVLARVRAVFDGEGDGVLPLGVFLRPETHVAAYVVVAIESERAQGAVVRVGSTGACVAWLDGRRIGEHIGDRSLSLDADAWTGALRAGLNRLVLRIAVGDRQPELLVRLTDREGRPLAGVRLLDAAMAAARAALPTSTSAARAAARSLRSSLAEAARRSPEAALDRDAYLLLSGVAGPRPEEACADLARYAARPPTRRHAELLLECASDGDARRRVLEARLASVDAGEVHERVWLQTQLGELALRGRIQQLGEERLRAAATAGDEHETWRARLRLAELDADRGLGALAERALDALVTAAPARRVREARALQAQRSGRRREALADYAVLSAELPGDVSLRRQVVAQLRARGTPADLEGALVKLGGPGELRDREAVAIERAELEEGLGRADRAVLALEALLVVAPDDARTEERLGRLLFGLDRRKDALVHLRRALLLRPQSPELRGLLAEVDAPRAGGDLARRYGVDLAALRARAAKAPLGRDDPARVLYDGETVRVHDNGLQESYVERVIEVGDRRGAEAEGEVAIRYAPDSQSVEVLAARIYKANGDVVESATVDERDISEPWYSIYYDERAQVVTLPGVEPGDVLYVAYTVSDNGRRNQLGTSFGELHLLQEEMVRLESVYRLIAPRGRTLYFNQPKLGGAPITPTITEDGEERRYEFSARDVPKIQPEAGMPGQTELGAYVHASTFASWDDVARFYRVLVASQLEPDAAIRRAANEAVRGKKTVAERVAAIYDLVVRSTRYVGLEFGVHGYQPYRVSQIWERRFGDCKDKATLLVVMLKEVGVDATMILLRTRHEGAVDPMPASLALFDHAIAYVPALDRYLDGTAEFSGSTELPPSDQGVAGLHVDEGVLRTTPVLGPEATRLETRLDVTVARDGSATAEDRRVVSGAMAEAWRRRYEAPDQRKDRYEKVWALRSAGAEVRTIALPHLEDRERPVEVTATLRLPRLARLDGPSALALPVLLRPPQLSTSFARLSTRRHALELPEAIDEVEHVRLRLPAGARALPPAAVVLQSRFGRFTLRAELRDGDVLIDAETVLGVRRVEAADYAAFRDFLAAIDRAIATELHLEVGP